MTTFAYTSLSLSRVGVKIFGEEPNPKCKTIGCYAKVKGKKECQIANPPTGLYFVPLRQGFDKLNLPAQYKPSCLAAFQKTNAHPIETSVLLC